MERIAVKTFSPIQFFAPLDFKSNLLFFDKIYIHHTTVSTLMRHRKLSQHQHSQEEYDLLVHNYRELEFLLQQDLVAEYKSQYDEFAYETPEECELEQWIDQEIKKLLKDQERIHGRWDYTQLPSPQQWKESLEMENRYFDLETRRNVLGLKRLGHREVYPLLATASSYRAKNKKQEVVAFLLQKFPVPNENTSWEQFLDFKKDPDVKSNYLALIQWINTAAAANRPVHEIEDEYNYLYDQYSRSVRLHRLKINVTIWEILVHAGMDLLTTLGATGIVKNLFAYRKEKIALLESELQLPGREIAYIHKANQAFGAR